MMIYFQKNEGCFWNGSRDLNDLTHVADVNHDDDDDDTIQKKKKKKACLLPFLVLLGSKKTPLSL